MRAFSLTRSALDELLAAVDVESRPGNGGVRHQVDGQGGDVLGANDAMYRQGCAQLFAAPVEAVPEDRRGERREETPSTAPRTPVRVPGEVALAAPYGE